MTRTTQTILLLAIACFTLPALAQDVAIDAEDVQLGKPEYSPYLGHGYPDRVYFGATHVHTSYSADAGMFGTHLGPEVAYRFALGEHITHLVHASKVRGRHLRPSTAQKPGHLVTPPASCTDVHPNCGAEAGVPDKLISVTLWGSGGK